MISRAAALWLWTASAVSAGGQLYEAVEPHMGTLVRIKVYAASDGEAAAGFRAAFARIAELDQTLSDYLPESELNRVCRSAVRRPIAISRDLYRVLAAGQQLAEESNGAFDVTLGPVIRLWRDARRERRLPSPDALREAAERCGYRKLHLDGVARTVTLDQPDMRLDLGAIAKGYAAGEAIAVLDKLELQRALVAVSGDLAAGDPPPGARGWRVAIGASDKAVELARMAISTSGDDEQHLDLGGKRYSHIIDPATLTGLTVSIEVTVVAPRGMDADSLATAISVLGAERGIALLGRHPGSGARITSRGSTVESPNWTHVTKPLETLH